MGEQLKHDMTTLARESPDFKKALNVILKYQIYTLLQRLSDNGEESVMITVSVADGVKSQLGSRKGEDFLQNAHEFALLKERFLKFCGDMPQFPSTPASSSLPPSAPTPSNQQFAGPSKTSRSRPMSPQSDNQRMGTHPSLFKRKAKPQPTNHPSQTTSSQSLALSVCSQETVTDSQNSALNPYMADTQLDSDKPIILDVQLTPTVNVSTPSKRLKTSAFKDTAGREILQVMNTGSPETASKGAQKGTPGRLESSKEEVDKAIEIEGSDETTSGKIAAGKSTSGKGTAGKSTSGKYKAGKSISGKGRAGKSTSDKYTDGQSTSGPSTADTSAGHQSSGEKSAAEEKSDDFNIDEYIEQSNKDMIRRCYRCEYKTKQADLFSKHLQTCKIRSRKFVCRICKHQFRLKRYLSKHMKTHGEKKFACTFCDKAFVSPYKKKRHMSNVHRERDAIPM